MSHPAWVCGLKPYICKIKLNKNESHPAWVCGLKPNVPNNHTAYT